MHISQKMGSAGVFFYYINVLFVLFINDAYALPTKYINYKIEPDSQYSCVNVSGAFSGDPRGEYLLRLPTGEPNINFNSKQGSLEYETTSNPRVIKVKGETNQAINFNYKLCHLNPYRSIDHPIIEKDFIQFSPTPALITFKDNEKENVLIGIDLSAYSDNLKAFTSYNYNLKKFVTITNMQDFSDSVISIGDFNVNHHKLKDKDVYVVANGSWPYFQKNPSEYVAALVKTQREFWDDHHFPVYVVFLMKQNPSFPVPKYIGGTHKHNVSILFLPEEKNHITKVFHAFSHENFHAWLGKKMKVRVPQGDVQWFVEGFNDFYGLFLLEKSKLISIADYVDFYNFLMTEYMLSPINSVSNEEIRKYYKYRGQYDRVALLRGHFIAKQLRDELNVSSQENPVDLAMKEVFSRYQKENQSFISHERIGAAFKEHVGVEKWEQTNQFINADKQIRFSPSAFFPYAKLVDLEMDAPDFGFDVKALFSSNAIAQVDVNSNAYHAGLREGDIVKYYQLDHVSPKKEVMIAIDNNGTEKIIKFKPKVVKKMVPQYVMVKGDVFEKRLRNRHV